MFYQVLLLTISISHICSAEYVINILTNKFVSKSPAAYGLETAILDDGFQGCVPLPSTATNWFKPNFDNGGLYRYLWAYSSSDCSGARVGGPQSYRNTGPNQLQGFAGSVNSIKITFPNSDRRDTTDEGYPVSELTLGPGREVINATADAKITRRGLDGFNLILNGDRFINRLTSGLFATWQYGDIEHGRDLSTPTFTSNADLWTTWAEQIGRSWTTDRPTGINPHLDGTLNNGNLQVAGWHIALNGRHTTSDITYATLTNAVWRAIEYANANGDTWIKFDILDWSGSDSIATVNVWMEGEG